MSEDNADEEDEVDVQIVAHFCDPAVLTRLDAVIQKTGRPRSSFVEGAILEKHRGRRGRWLIRSTSSRRLKRNTKNSLWAQGSKRESY